MKKSLLQCVLVILVAATSLAAPTFTTQDPQADFRTAVSHIRTRNYTAAIQLLRELIERDPRDANSQFLMGVALTESNRLEEANQYLRKAGELNPDLQVAFRALAMNEFAMGNPASAEPLFERFLRANPSDEVSHAFLARIHAARGDFQKALNHLEKARSLWEKDPQLKLVLLEALLRVGKLEAAANVFSGRKQEPQMEFRIGLLFAENGHPEKAAAYFSSCIEQEPGFVPARYNLALVRFKSSGRLAEAKTLLEAIEKEGKADFEVLDLLAEVYTKSDLAQEAIQLRKEMIERFPKEEKGYLSLIQVCVRLYSFDLALEVANQGLENLPRSVPLTSQRALLHLLKGRMDLAEKDYRRAIDLDPGNDWLRVGHAASLLDDQRPREAIPIVRGLIGKGLSHYFVFHLLGEALVDLAVSPGSSEEEEAIDVLEKSIALEPAFAPTRLNLAKLHRARGELGQAVAQLEAALELEPENTAALYQLGEIHRQRKEMEAARRLFEKVGRINADAQALEERKSVGIVHLIRMLENTLKENPEP